jgi:hypothetical protein
MTHIVKNFIAAFLVVLMLMPSLACAMPTCTGKEAAAVNKPCAEHHPGHDSKSSKQSGKVNLLIDCMGVDLQKADTASMEKPDLKIGFVVYALANETASDFIIHKDAGSIRGPPPDWPALLRTQPSILLTTQRFRI